jgi:hypothetical protein
MNKICKVREILSETDIIFKYRHLNCLSHRLINTVFHSEACPREVALFYGLDLPLMAERSRIVG